MRKLIFFVLTLCSVSAVFAETGDVATTVDYDSMIATFAGFSGMVVLLTEGIKSLFPKMNGLVTQIVSWCVGLLGAMLLWWLDAGFVSEVQWYVALLYGIGSSLVANGIADTGIIQWLIGLFSQKAKHK